MLPDETIRKEKKMGADHDEHDGPIHQSPWVFYATVGVCFAFAGLIIGIKYLTGTIVI